MVFSVIWSEEDQEWVGLCSAYPSLSFLDENKEAALQGIKELVNEVSKDTGSNSTPVQAGEDDILHTRYCISGSIHRYPDR